MKAKYFILKNDPKISPGYHVVDFAADLNQAYGLLLRKYDLSYIIAKVIDVEAKEK